jgi:hypothetical protein
MKRAWEARKRTLPQFLEFAPLTPQPEAHVRKKPRMVPPAPEPMPSPPPPPPSDDEDFVIWDYPSPLPADHPDFVIWEDKENRDPLADRRRGPSPGPGLSRPALAELPIPVLEDIVPPPETSQQ